MASINENKEYDTNSSSYDEIDYKEIIRAISRRKKWGITSGALLFIIIAAQTINQRIVNPIYQGTFSILISDPFTPKVTGNLDILKGRAPSYQGIANSSNKYDLMTLTRLLKSPIFLKNIANNFNINPRALSRSLTIETQNPNKPLSQAGVIDIKLRTKNKEKGISLLNELADTFLKESLLKKQQKLNDGLKFLNSQYPTIKREEEILQNKLVNFRKKYNLIDPLLESNSIKARKIEAEKMILKLNSLISRLRNVRLEIINGTMTARGFNEQIGKELGSDFVVNDFDQGILSQLISLEKEIAIAKLKFTSESSIIQGLEKKRKEIEPFLLDSQLESVDIAIKLIQARLTDTFIEKNNLEQQFLKYPGLIKEYQELSQELNFANENLLNLNAAISNFELDLAQSRIPWTIISTPRMGNVPIKPNVQKNLFRGLLVSLLCGILVSLIRDKLDNVFHGIPEVNERLNFPFLGNVPFFSSVKEIRETKSSLINALIMMDKNENTSGYYYENFYMSEALRNIYTSIRFLNSDKPLKTVLVASSIPKEGKSLINILLSKIFCDMGEKVLLIDADLRKPQIHERLSINNLIGLSDFLVNSQNKLNDVIQKSKYIKNLNIITAGSKVPDPTRLLNSQRFESLVNDLNQSKDYDIIIFDSPPILGLADSIIISQKLDGLIMLVSIDFVNRSLPEEAINRVRANNINILGLITNSIQEYTNKKLNAYNDFYKYSKNYSYLNYIPAKDYANNSIDSSVENIKKENRSDLSLWQNFKKDINSFTNNITKWLDS